MKRSILMFLLMLAVVSVQAQTSESKRKPKPTTTQTTAPKPAPKPVQTATPKPAPKPVQTTTQNNHYSGEKRTFTANGVSFTMVYVQGGTFTMGATSEQGNNARNNEKPTHSVTLSSFSIGETEVTQALWEAVMGESVTQIASRHGWPTAGVGSNYPMYDISWNDCQTFISKLNNLLSSQLGGKRFRMPTEAEWEYAARGGNKSKDYKFCGTNNLGDVAWYGVNSNFQTHPVKQKQANELGIYDMSGNVWEWCQDWYGDYNSSSQTNPTDPSSGSYRVLRGGCWNSDAWYCRSSNRYYYNPNDRIYSLGLRLALSE